MVEQSRIQIYETREYLGRHIIEDEKRHYLVFSPQRYEKFQSLDDSVDICVGIEIIRKKDLFRLLKPEVRLDPNDTPMKKSWMIE